MNRLGASYRGAARRRRLMGDDIRADGRCENDGASASSYHHADDLGRDATSPPSCRPRDCQSEENSRLVVQRGRRRLSACLLLRGVVGFQADDYFVALRTAFLRRWRSHRRLQASFACERKIVLRVAAGRFRPSCLPMANRPIGDFVVFC